MATNRHLKFWTFYLVGIVALGGVALLLWASGKHDSGGVSEAAAPAGLLVLWLLAFPFCWWTSSVVRPLARQTLKPIPTPAEIHQQLWYELGREPSLDEVFAVEAHLKSERNEAAITLGAVLIGLHLAAKHDL